MTAPRSFTLSEIARRLDVPQHKLIHLCEKGAVVPEIHDAAGRGSSRVFSANNFLELAVALRLRDMMIPVSVAGAIVHVLRRFGQELRTASDGASLAESLRGPDSPELRVIVSDGETIFFSLAKRDRKTVLFGGIPLQALISGSAAWDGKLQERGTSLRVTAGNHPFGGPEGSKFARMELSVTSIARSLPLD
jgi:DNA-binding transcriptional MerR regulator